jgi:hypothetical protein
MKIEDVIRVLTENCPGAKFYTSDGSLVWIDDTEKPSDDQILKWISNLKSEPNWDRLLKESAPFVVKAQTTTNANSFSLLLMVLTTIRSVEWLRTSIEQVRTSMKQPYTVQEIADLNKLLSDCHIDLVLRG